MTVVNLPSNKSKSRGKGKWLLCLGGSIKLSPADDILIRVERALDVDGEGQMIALLSKNLRQAPPMLLLTFL
jgi:thymidine phosphorylase